MREWLYWYDEQGKRYLTPEERIQQGLEQGIEQGRVQGKLESVPRLLALGLTVQKIAEALGLEVEQVNSVSEK